MVGLLRPWLPTMPSILSRMSPFSPRCSRARTQKVFQRTADCALGRRPPLITVIRAIAVGRTTDPVVALTVRVLRPYQHVVARRARIALAVTGSLVTLISDDQGLCAETVIPMRHSTTAHMINDRYIEASFLN